MVRSGIGRNWMLKVVCEYFFQDTPMIPFVYEICFFFSYGLLPRVPTLPSMRARLRRLLLSATSQCLIQSRHKQGKRISQTISSFMNARDWESAEPDITTAPIPASRMSHTALTPRMFITLPSNHRTLITGRRPQSRRGRSSGSRIV